MIKAGIIGYGNLGRGVEASVSDSADMELSGIFTRRKPESIETVSGASVYSFDEIRRFKDKIDVMILCAGSATDLPAMTPLVAEAFTLVDSFDTHRDISLHLKNVDKAAVKGGNVAIISAGWDPGLFSLNRLYGKMALSKGESHTFWGRGISQGHSEAIRSIEGVIDARQYTVPVESAMEAVRSGETLPLSAEDKHLRECYVVAAKNADKADIEHKIKTMANYFADYDTRVYFVTMEELEAEHNRLIHGGVVIRNGNTGFCGEYKNTLEYKLKLDSNPFFTGSVMVGFVRAAYRMKKQGITGAKTVFDIPPYMLLSEDREDIIADLL